MLLTLDYSETDCFAQVLMNEVGSKVKQSMVEAIDAVVVLRISRYCDIVLTKCNQFIR